MGRMSPNQSGTTSSDESTTVVADGRPDENADSFLTTDCAHFEGEVPMKNQITNSRIPSLGFPVNKERVIGLNGVTQMQKQVPTSNCPEAPLDEDADDYEDDRSSVVTESSVSDDENHREGIFHEGLRKSADTLAVDAINCASNELGQPNKNGVICVNSQFNGSPRDVTVGRANNGYVTSEVGRLGRSHAEKCNNKELVLRPANQVVPQESLATAIAQTPSGLPTTAIFNESSDITLGNKTFITGSLTIKQYIKDSGPNALNEPPPSPWRRLSTRKKVALIGAAVVLITGLIATIVVLSLPNGQSRDIGDGDDSRYNIPIESSIKDDLTSLGTVLRFVPRGQWIAQPPKSVLTKLNLPVKRVIIAHTATENCTTQSSCVYQVRQIQTYHMESVNWDDIGYNFLVGGDGAAYEGRGWENQGAHTKGYNTGSICIAFIGTFTQYEPPARQINVAKRLIEEGVRLNKIAKDYKVYGHRQFYATESPGEKLFNLLVKWDHWGNDVV